MADITAPLSYFMDDATWWDQYAIDPVLFIEDCIQITSPTLGITQLKLYQHQKDLVNIYDSNKWVYASSARQVGTSTIGMAYLLWQAIFYPGASVGIAGCTTGVALNEISIIHAMYRGLPDPVKNFASIKLATKTSISFNHGSNIIADNICGNTFKGHTISTLYVSCPSHCTHQNWDEFCESSVAIAGLNNSNMIIIDGVQNKLDVVDTFGLYHCKIPWNVVPGRGEQFREDVIKNIGQKMWNIEYGD